MASIKHNGYRLQVFPNDHRPPHAHVFSPSGWEYRFTLLKEGGTGKLLSARGKGRNNPADSNAAADAVAKHHAALLTLWNTYHENVD
jgi:hypothetical protein